MKIPAAQQPPPPQNRDVHTANRNPLPIESDALRANIAGTAITPEIPERFRILLEAVADHYGPRRLLRETLDEYFHQFRNAGTVIDSLQTILLRDWTYFDKHPARRQLSELMLEIVLSLLRSPLPDERTTQLLRQVLLWMTTILQGEHGHDYIDIGIDAADALRRLLPRMPISFLERDKPLRTLARTALALEAVPSSVEERASKMAVHLASLYRQVLRLGYLEIADHLDVAAWAQTRDIRLRDEARVVELFGLAERDRMESLAKRALAVPPEQIISEDFPTFSEVVDSIIRQIFSIENLEDRFAVCLYLLKDNTLGLRQREVMVELLAVVRLLIEPSHHVHFHRILRRLARFFRQRERLFPDMRLQCYETIGVAIGEAGAVGAADRITDDLLSWNFEYPDVCGATDEWQMLANPYHLANIRCWMRIVQSNPALYERLAAALAVALRLGGAFIADTDLFQKDITSLLNADLKPVYSVIKQLLRSFPAYFNEIGAEGELRSVSTEIDEICGRKDTLMHFLRKQVHAESSSRLIDFTRAVLDYWKTLDDSLLAPYVSPNTLLAVANERSWAEGPHAVVVGEPASAEDRRRVTLVRRMLELLEIKYSTSPKNLAVQVDAVAGLPKETRTVFVQSLTAWEVGLQSPQPGIMATVYRYSRARIREALLDSSLDILEALREIILNPVRSEGRENIFRKRHIAAGIPSMYGTYREPKFDALGLSFRIEALVGQLLDEIADEITDQYVSRASLRRFASNFNKFGRALAVDGINSQNLQSDFTLLREGAGHRSFTYAQCRNVFQFLAHGVSNLVRLSTQTYDQALRVILERDDQQCVDRGLTPDALTESILRELVVSTLGLQSLDRYVSNALRHLTDLGDKVSERDLTRMMNYDPDRLVSWLNKPQPNLDSQMTLGYKALGLKEMMSYGYRVPQGFVLTTELFAVFSSMSHRPLYEHTIARIRHALAQLEDATGLHLGDPERPLTLSIRSGAAISMPGLMLTLINVGLNDELTAEIATQPEMAWTAWDSYRRFIQSWAMSAGLDRDIFDEIIAGYKDKYHVAKKVKFSPEQMREIAQAYRARAQELGVVFIDDPFLQIIAAIGRVLDSWYAAPARFYRRYMGISDHWGTAVIIQRMVLGNLSHESGSGVTFTRSLVESHGRQVRLFGDFAIGAQGEDLVGGLVFPLPVSEAQRRASPAYRGVRNSLESRFPLVYKRLLEVAQDLVSTRHHDPQEIEFTFESPDPEDLYILQKRSMVEDVEEELPLFLRPTKGRLPKPDAVGIGVSGGAIAGRVAVSAAQIDILLSKNPEERVVLIRPDTVPEEIAMIVRAQGLLTARGGATSHAAVTAKRLGKTAVVDCRNLEVDEVAGTACLAGRLLNMGDWLSMDGHTGQIFFGKREVVSHLTQANRGYDSRGSHHISNFPVSKEDPR